jgi:hypothetical protein
MCGDDSLTVRQVGPTAAVISRGDLGDEHRRAGVATILTGKEPMIPIEDISINMTSLPAIARRTSITLARIVIG